MSETTAAIPAPKRSKKSLLIIGGTAVVALAAGGGGAFWWSQKAQAQSPAESHEPAKHEDDGAERGIVSFEPFVVNLADPGASRFLRVKVQLVVEDPEIAEAAGKSPVKVSRARSAILELLTTQTSDVLVTQEGKAELKKAILEGVGNSLGTEILDVLFSDFVVQF